MKRTQLKRRKPITRRPLKRRPRTRSKYRSRPRDLAYMAWIRRQLCAIKDRLNLRDDCYGRVEADHAGLRPVGRKSDDRTCIPLCRKHHTQRGSFSGVFRSWDKAMMRNWLDDTIKLYQRMYQNGGSK